MNKSYVYILTNKYNTILYVGVTSNLIQRIIQHKEKRIPGFTSKYKIDKLVFFEEFNDIRFAIEREKQIKGGSRENKIALIESMNPEWKDLCEGMI